MACSNRFLLYEACATWCKTRWWWLQVRLVLERGKAEAASCGAEQRELAAREAIPQPSCCDHSQEV